MDTRADTTPSGISSVPMAVEKSAEDVLPFVDLVREHASWLEQEIRQIGEWMEEHIGIRPDEVRLSPAWFGEDRRLGVVVFRASIHPKPGEQRPPVTDWWVICERSGQRWFYPCMLSTSGDAVRYHQQIREAQLRRKG